MEDGLLKDEKLTEMLWNETGDLIDSNYSHVARKIAQAQAEISFKAGLREAVRLAILCDAICSEKEALENGCVTCQSFYRQIKEMGIS